uniref:Uncharacterized protein n=1 Tax=Odontella aurita TaxID=265563 RepID=A0A7S4K8Z0_9STRA
MTVGGEMCESPLLMDEGRRKTTAVRRESFEGDEGPRGREDGEEDENDNDDGERRQARPTSPGPPAAVPSQIEPESIGMDEISVLSMCEPLMSLSPRSPKGGKGTLKCLAEQEDEDEDEDEDGEKDPEADEEGVEIVELLPSIDTGYDDNDDGADDCREDATVTPIYRSSDNVSVVFCRRSP